MPDPDEPSALNEAPDVESDLRAVFCCEAIELVQRLEETLIALPLASRGAAPRVQLELLRLLHSLKGAAAAAGETDIRDAAHALEAGISQLCDVDQRIIASALSTLAAGLASIRAKLWWPEGQARPLAARQPFKQSLAGWSSVVREAAHECGKQVRLLIRADQAESERELLSRLREPLLHLLRNAVAHGIEPAAERLLRGKEAIGTVAIETHCALLRGTIWVIDDGAGIAIDAVKRRARELGLVDGASPLETATLLDVLCHPGFSMRDSADTLAGRGVGLHAVRGALAEMGGTLSLHSVVGAGCVFMIELPLHR